VLALAHCERLRRVQLDHGGGGQELAESLALQLLSRETLGIFLGQELGAELAGSKSGVGQHLTKKGDVVSNPCEKEKKEKKKKKVNSLPILPSSLVAPSHP